jgi:hypothetical protein
MKWGVCAAITADVYKTIIKFVRNPSLNESLVADLIGSLHNLINSVHNGGPLLNKFGLHQDDLDGIARGNLLIFHKAIYGIRDLLKLKPNTQHAEALAKAKQIKISRKAYGLPIDAYMKARTEPRYGVDTYDVYWFDDKYPPPVGTVGFNPSQHHAYTIIRGLRDD